MARAPLEDQIAAYEAGNDVTARDILVIRQTSLKGSF
jgi:2-keto-4-pentenoate hydratase/2-oxohepta-3-ene-1,7-dioic acid hydratase in catechol pathway